MTAAIAEKAGAYGAARAREAGQRARQTAVSARAVPGDRQYQGVILAEFLVAMILVAAGPIAKGPSPAAAAKGSPSPYDTGDIKQLVAIGGTYFILALFSSGSRGRAAAWIGGLILLAIGMSKAGQGHLAAIGNVFKPDTGAGKQAGEVAGGAVGGDGTGINLPGH